VRSHFTLVLVVLFCVGPASGMSSTFPAASPAATPQATGQSATVIPSTFFGMTLINKSNWPTVPFGALGEGTQVGWAYVEQTKGVFDWSNIDAWVNLAQQEQISFFYPFGGAPPWAVRDQTSCASSFPGGPKGCGSMVANIQDLDDFVTALVSRYKGRIQIYELWNEPDAFFTGTIADLVTLTTHEYNLIRSTDPNTFILSPAPCCSGSYLDDYFAAGGPTGVDGISFHAYNAVPETALNYTNNIKNIAAKYGLSSKPFWATEGSWGTNTLSSDNQIGAVARFYMLQWSAGVSRFYWYAWDGDSWGPLWDPATGPHPAATAYQQVYKWMVGATMTSPCTMASDSTWTCTLTRPGGYQALAVWNSATTLNYTPSSQYKQYRDLVGRTNPVSGSVSIGYNPILLESQGLPTPPSIIGITVK
jgi:hypothetical protein